jgi:hypothetical protein
VTISMRRYSEKSYLLPEARSLRIYEKCATPSKSRPSSGRIVRKQTGEEINNDILDCVLNSGYKKNYQQSLILKETTRVENQEANEPPKKDVVDKKVKSENVVVIHGLKY